MIAPNIQQIIDDAWAAQIAADASALAAVQTADAAALAAAQAQAQAAETALATYQQHVEGTLGPLWDSAWQKQSYRGFDLDLAGYHETFRSDFNSLSEISGRNGSGPWYSGVHAYILNAYTDDITENPQLFRLDTPGVLTLRMMTPDGNVNTSWRAPIIQTMKANGEGFAQSKGIFEARIKMPAAPAYGFDGGFWLLSAADYHPEITDHLIEIDHSENYGGQPTLAAPSSPPDKGMHSTVHVKPRRVPQPGDYPTRVYDSLYSDPQTVFNTDPATGGASTVHTFPANVALFDGQFHTYTTEITDDWVTVFFDGKSIGRYPNVKGYFSTPLYMIISITLKRPPNSSVLVSPIDMQVDYVRAMAKS